MKLSSLAALTLSLLLPTLAQADWSKIENEPKVRPSISTPGAAARPPTPTLPGLPKS